MVSGRFPVGSHCQGQGGRADFETTRGGGRFSASIGGALTGRGGDIIIMDDPHKPEDAASDVKRQQCPEIRGIIPKDDKATRMLSVTGLIEGGRIAVPSDAPWLADFHREIIHFPNGKYDDQVDSVSQFLKWLAEPRHVTKMVRFKL